MKYAVEMGSGAMIYIPSFIKIGSGIPEDDVSVYPHLSTFECLNQSRPKIR
jgi:hypothetical protein